MKRALFLLFIGSALLLLSSCAETNVDAIRGGVVQVDDFRDFKGTEKLVWKALINALSEKEIIKTFDRSSGLVVTEYGTVEDRELEAIKTLFLAMTYKYSYTVNLQPLSSNQTRVKVKVNLLGQQVGFYEREVGDIAVEKYLTKDLFDRVCRFLSPGNPYGCSDSPHGSYQSPEKNRKPTPPEFTGDPQTRSVQQRLLDLGYSPGRPDGKMGKKTRRAITRFQQDNGIPAHSKLDVITLQALGINGVPEEVVPPKAPSPPGPPRKPGGQPDKPVPPPIHEEPPEVEDTPPPIQEPQVDESLKGYNFITLSPTVVKKDSSVLSENLGEIPENSYVTVLQEGTSWHQVRFKNQTGFVLATLVDKRKKERKKNTVQEETPTKKQPEYRNKAVVQPVAEEKVEATPATAQKPPPTPEPEPIGTGIINGATHLYSKPSVMSSKQAKINHGKTVEIFGEEKGFYKVKINNKEGFVYKDFVDMGN